MFVTIMQYLAVIGTILTGLFALIAPSRIEGFTGLTAVGGRGITEFRSIFGGLFIGLGIAALALDAAVAFPMLGIMYLAIATVRLPSMYLDKSVEQSNIISVVVEVVFGVFLLI